MKTWTTNENGRKKTGRITLCMGLVLLFCFMGSASGLSERLVLPQGLTVIEEEAFMGDDAITAVTMPEGIEEIRTRAFAESGVGSVNLPSSITYIADDAFDGCDLRSVAAEEGSYAYEWCGEKGIEIIKPIIDPTNYTFALLNDGTCEVTGYTGNEKDLLIPWCNSEGINVTRIADGAFWDNTHITSVKIPIGVVEIGEQAFYFCDQLKQIEFPEGLLRIEEYAFYSCDSLEEVHIPDSVKTMGEYAFGGCELLSKVNYPVSWQYTKGYASPFAASDHITEFAVPEGVKVIANHAFNWCDNLNSVILPDSVTSIGQSAFYQCSSLKKIDLPAGLKSIGMYAFDDCGVENLLLPASLESYYCGFMGCKNLKSVKCSEGLKIIDSSAFSDCRSLVDVDLPEGLIKIGSGAFSNTSITSIRIPETVREFASGFRDCKKLKTVILPDNLTIIDDWAFKNCVSLETVKIPESVCEIATCAFEGCVNLVSMNLPENITEINGGAFQGCISLSNINYPIKWGWISGWSDDKKSPFGGCTNLKTIYVPKGATRIADNAFLNSNLEQIYIADTVEYIGENAFDGVSESLIIYGVSGSYAEFYANEHGIAFYADKLPDQGEMKTTVLYGKVQMSNGYPLAGAAIIVNEGKDNNVVGQTVSGKDGKWSVEDLKGNTEYRVKCALAPFWFNSVACYTYAEKQEIAPFIGVTDEEFVLTDVTSIRAEAVEWTQDIQIQTQSNWKAEATADWIELSAPEGRGNSVLTVSLSANPDEIRTGTIWVSTDTYMQDISVVQIGESSNRLGTPTITYPAEDGAVIPYGEIEVTWEPVNGAEHYVVSLRDLTTNDLLLNHSLTAQSDGMTALLSEAYFFPGNDYRVAVGAVPGGLSSNDPIVGWCEREFSIPQEEISDTSIIYGRVCAYEEANGIQEKMPVSNMIVSLYETLEDDELIMISSVITDETGMWRFENCKPETRYSITVSQGVSLMNISVIDGSDDLAASASCNTVPGDNNMGDIVIVNGKIEVAEAKQGLFAEYFQYKNQSNVIDDANKRYENIVSHIDFSWKTLEETDDHIFIFQVPKNNTSYSKLKASGYDGSDEGYGTIRYVKLKKFGALFNGYFVPSVTGQYQFRLIGDDGVKLTVGSMSDKDWGNGSNNKAVVGDRKNRPLNLIAEDAVWLEIEYYNDSGDANLKLEYQIAVDGKWTNEWKIVPPENLKRGNRRHHVSDDWFDVAQENAELDKKIKDFGKGKVGDIINDLIGGKVLKPVYAEFFKDSSSMTQWQYKIGINMKNIVGKSIINSVYKTIVGATITGELEISDMGEQIVNGLIGKANLKLNDEKAIELKSLEWTDSADIFKNVVDIMAFVDECLPDSYDGLKNALNEILLYETNYVTGQVVGDSGMQAIAESVADEFGIIGSIIKTAVKAAENTEKYNDSDLIRSYIYLAITEGKYSIQHLPEWIEIPLMTAGGSLSNYADKSWRAITVENFDAKLSAAQNSTLVYAFHEEMKEIGNNMEVIVYKQLLIDTMGMMCDVYGDFKYSDLDYN